MHSIIKLQGALQNYAWGGRTFLPALLGVHAAGDTRYAEYWLGTHPAGEARVLGNETATLRQWLQQKQQVDLPFLFKVLDVASMLSIQVHPTRAQASAGFAREDAAGVELEAATRSYKDRNHKPEMMLALSDFWLLHGLADAATLARRCLKHPCLQPLADLAREAGLKQALLTTLDADHEQTAAMQLALAAELANAAPFADKHDPDFWAQRWLRANPDTLRGLLTLYFMNVVHLKEGEVIYQPCGLLHAYLEGRNIELMAASDNVLRAGLTPKHLDVAELTRIALLEPTAPDDWKIHGQRISDATTVFTPPTPEFELLELCLGDAKCAHFTGETEIAWVLEGAAVVENAEGQMTIEAGESVALAPASAGEWRAAKGSARLFIARGSKPTSSWAEV